MISVTPPSQRILDHDLLAIVSPVLVFNKMPRIGCGNHTSFVVTT
jgi:hypothetical protein